MLDKTSEEYVKMYTTWQKKFVQGDQFTYLNEFNNEITEQVKAYYWQEYRVYNLLKATVDRWDSDYDPVYIWGPGKAVDQLIPYQQEYNAMMNRISRLSEQIACPTLCVEDGSVDVDELCEEGLAPGKVVVYRQGSNSPNLLNDTGDSVTALYQVARGIKDELIQLMNDLERNFE